MTSLHSTLTWRYEQKACKYRSDIVAVSQRHQNDKGGQPLLTKRPVLLWVFDDHTVIRSTEGLYSYKIVRFVVRVSVCTPGSLSLLSRTKLVGQRVVHATVH